MKPAQKSAHDLPSGIGELAQFFSWQSQYFWHSGDIAGLELPASPDCVVLPALPLAFEPPLELPALVAGEPALLEPDLPPLPSPSESSELQPNVTHHSTAPATKTDDLITRAYTRSDRLALVPFT